MSKRIQLMDCTLRDGGFCLEDAAKNGILVKEFDKEECKQIADLLCDTGIDIIELGSVEISENDKTGYAIYQNVERFSEQIPRKLNRQQKVAVMFRGPDTPLEDIPNWNPSLCEVVRVILRYSELKKSLDFCRALSDKGYMVCVQPMLTMRYTEEELDMLIDAANEMGAYALYFVDSYGYMESCDVKRLFELFDQRLHPSIKIGFHAHNNMNLAFSNVLTFLEISEKREIIIDACALGMGQGAGNLQTEIIVDYMNSVMNSHYDMGAVLEICEIIETHNQERLWGYSVERFIAAARKTAYKYAVALRDKYGLSYREMNEILQEIPEELRHRYTIENTKRLLELKGK